MKHGEVACCFTAINPRQKTIPTHRTINLIDQQVLTPAARFEQNFNMWEEREADSVSQTWLPRILRKLVHHSLLWCVAELGRTDKAMWFNTDRQAWLRSSSTERCFASTCDLCSVNITAFAEALRWWCARGLAIAVIKDIAVCGPAGTCQEGLALMKFVSVA